MSIKGGYINGRVSKGGNLRILLKGNRTVKGCLNNKKQLLRDTRSQGLVMKLNEKEPHIGHTTRDVQLFAQTKGE